MAAVSNREKFQTAVTGITLLASVAWAASTEIRLDRLERAEKANEPIIDTRYARLNAGTYIQIGGKDELRN